MVNPTFNSEFTSSIPPARLFKALILDDSFITKVLPIIKSVEIVQGDGGVGTIKKIHYTEGSRFTSAKQRVDALDKDNFTYTHTVIEVEGSAKNESIESVSYGFRFEASADGGSIIKTCSTYHTKGDAQISEEEIKAGKERAASLFKATETYLLANPDAYK